MPMRKKSVNLFNDHRINEPIRIKSGNLFNDPRINKNNHTKNGGARGVVVIAVGNEHGDTSSIPGRD